VGVELMAGIGIVAFCLRSWILSLYAAFNSFTFRSPSLFSPYQYDSIPRNIQLGPAHSFAFLSSFSLYLSRTLSDCCVAKNRTS